LLEVKGIDVYYGSALALHDVSLEVFEGEIVSVVGSNGAGKSTLLETLEWIFILSERKNQSAGTLSGGEQQMLAIGRGLMSRPKLLMLDEPSLGLAPKLVMKTFDIIRAVNDEGITVLLVEQNVLHSLRLCDRGYVLENGTVALSGSGEELSENEHVKKTYLGL